jgi:hypothetical protein
MLSPPLKDRLLPIRIRLGGPAGLLPGDPAGNEDIDGGLSVHACHPSNLLLVKLSRVENYPERETLRAKSLDNLSNRSRSVTTAAPGKQHDADHDHETRRRSHPHNNTGS